MRKFLLFVTVTIVAIISSCSSSNKTVSYAEDKAYYDALKKLSKKPNEPLLQRDVVDLYNQAVQQHEARISSYKGSMELNRYDRMLAEYNTLQRINESIRTSSVFREVSSKNYLAETQSVKEEAAAAYYDEAMRNLDEGTKQSARRAYEQFGRSRQYVQGYKDTDRMTRIAYESSIVNILINPISNAFNGSWGGSWNVDPRFMYMHQDLVRDLGGQNGNGTVRYFTDMDARRLNIRPDWVIDINWSFMSSPPNVVNRYNRDLSKQIEAGKDTSGRPVYQTVRATLHVTRYQNPPNDIDYRIVDVESNRTLDWNRIQTNSNTGVFETATFTGDSRALDSNDWNLVNNRQNGMQEQMVREMYNDLQRELRSRIQARL